MPKNFKCIGCGSDKFTSDRGLAHHRNSCGPFKRLQKQKVQKLAIPPPESVFVASSLDGLISCGLTAEETADIAQTSTAVLEPEAVAPSPPQEYRPSGLPRRKTRPPKRFDDLLPAPPPLVIPPEVDITAHVPTSTLPDDIPPPSQHQTKANSYGVYRIYKSGPPSFTPDHNFRINSVANGPNFMTSRPFSGASWG